MARHAITYRANRDVAGLHPKRGRAKLVRLARRREREAADRRAAAEQAAEKPKRVRKTRDPMAKAAAEAALAPRVKKA